METWRQDTMSPTSILYNTTSNAESVRDLQFNPHHSIHFCAVSESGNVQLWDMRRPDRVEKQFTAHGGPIFALDWHPEVKTWIATAGRDKTIKVGMRKSLTESCCLESYTLRFTFLFLI
ncbi:WD repeat-containing protein 24 [Portunus trituberculatus]|uniref:GATOR2 complex protein WDR24 n=1 Tax=Portunus trituberculatus TaxID=210409 RepID=A0A5B7HAE0_PORTR|nr:WD repeat-containing protein 24 [Portunus trituberculatus]